MCNPNFDFGVHLGSVQSFLPSDHEPVELVDELQHELAMSQADVMYLRVQHLQLQSEANVSRAEIKHLRSRLLQVQSEANIQSQSSLAQKEACTSMLAMNECIPRRCATITSTLVCI